MNFRMLIYFKRPGVIFKITLALLILHAKNSNAQSIPKDSLLTLYQNDGENLETEHKISLFNDLAKKYRFRSPDSLKLFADELISLGNENNNPSSLILGTLRIGNYYSDIGDNKKALEKYHEAKELSQKVNDPKLLIDLHTQLTIEFFYTRQLDKTLEAAYKGIELSKKNEFLSTEARLRHILGFIYTQNKLYDEADSELYKAIKLWEESGDSLSLYASRSNLARNSLLSGNVEKAQQYFEGNISYFKKSKDLLWLARSYMVECLIKFKNQQWRLALESNKRYDSLLRKLNTPRDRILTYNLYSKLFFLSKDFEKAKAYADSTVYYSLNLKDSVELLNGYDSLSEMAIEKADYDEAAKYSSLALPIKTVLDNRFREDNLKLLRTKHELEFEQLEKDLADGKKLIRQQRITALLLLMLVISIGLLVYARQIVQKRKNINKELQKISQTKNKLFSIIGHDLKSPIETLKELLDLYGSDELSSEDISKALPRLKQNVDQSAFTLNNLLFWANSQMNGLKGKPERVNLFQEFKSVCYLFQETQGKKKIKLLNSIEKEHNIFVDKNHLSIILRNLCSNAYKFTPNGGQIVVKSKEVGNLIEFSIYDNGSGIDSKTLKAIESNTPIDPKAGTESEKGTGLGLLISKSLAAFNNGKLEIETALGTGTSVLLLFSKI